MTEIRSLRTRIPGQAAIAAFMTRYVASSRRSRIARFFGRSPLRADTRPWYRGALGELVVGEALDALGPQWDVLHAVPLGTDEADIDHVVIGPAGVFTVTTKNHSGQDVWVAGSTFLVAGERVPYVRNSQFEAARAAHLLGVAAGHPIEVLPMIVVIDPRRVTIGARPSGVEVVSSNQLMRWFDRAPRRLSGADVAAISDLADRPHTWQLEAGADEDAESLRKDFARVRADVNAAIRRRVLWGFIAVLACYLLAWAAVATFATTFVYTSTAP
ncbi:MAG: nuclease-related domain-containing protein [Rhodoglobus sp.]